MASLTSGHKSRTRCRAVDQMKGFQERPLEVRRAAKRIEVGREERIEKGSELDLDDAMG